MLLGCRVPGGEKAYRLLEKLDLSGWALLPDGARATVACLSTRTAALSLHSAAVAVA